MSRDYSYWQDFWDNGQPGDREPFHTSQLNHWLLIRYLKEDTAEGYFRRGDSLSLQTIKARLQDVEALEKLIRETKGRFVIYTDDEPKFLLPKEALELTLIAGHKVLQLSIKRLQDKTTEDQRILDSLKEELKTLEDSSSNTENDILL